MNDKTMQDLVENIIRQADYFLKEQGEFYPFAATLAKSGEIKPLGLLLKDNFPEAENVVKEFEMLLDKGIGEGEYQSAAIGINVTVKNEDDLESDALEIRLKPGKGRATRTLHLLYTFNRGSGDVEFGKFIELG